MRDINQRKNLSAPSVGQDPIVPSSSANEMLLQLKVKQLESELQLKETAIDQLLNEQKILREQFKTCVQHMQKSSKQLFSAKNEIQSDFQQVLAQIDELQNANKALQSTNEAWSNRSITLQFEVLTAQGEITAIKADYELAISKISLLETELKAVKTENDTLKTIKVIK